MNKNERQAFRPQTVKRNILGCIVAIRGTKKQISSWTGNPTALEAQIRTYRKEIRKLWSERKLNKWTN